MYKLLRNILFLFDAEKVHYFSMNILKKLCAFPLFKMTLKWMFTPFGNHSLELFGLKFKNRVGLGAGFDKNALYLTELDTIGFGFVEIGTVTPLPQVGNEKPRLFRLPKDNALLNRMGFNNDGLEIVAKRLRKWRSKTSKQKNSLIIGGNIGKNKITGNADAWKDYEICFRGLYDLVDYFAVNVSSPNTPGLRALQSKEELRKILDPLIQIKALEKIKKPLLLKISPDLNKSDLDDIIELTMEIGLDGLIVSNTTISRNNLITPESDIFNKGLGGISGRPLQYISDDMIQYINDKSNGQIKIIGSGGIFNGNDGLKKIRSGAQLVQVWTGFIYEGPGIIKKICKYIAHNPY